MDKIAIFGGTFDPVHLEHVNVVTAAIKELGLDKAIIVPSKIPPHKKSAVSAGEDRLNMLKIAFRNEPKAEISDFELKNDGTSYSYVTVEHFAELYRGAKLFLVVGGDMLENFKSWKYPERILARADICAAVREGRPFDEKKERAHFLKTFGKDFTLLRFSGADVSSTEIRTALALNLTPRGLDDKVYSYITERGLYPPDKYQNYILSHLPKKRIEHTANVIVCALKKAEELGLDREKVRIAATLHDCAKYDDPKNYADFILPEGVPQPVEHAFLGAFVAERKLGITDTEILDAIRYHTSGKAGMSKLAKLIFVADMIEKGRAYDGVDALRAIYDENFDECFCECVKEETEHLKNAGRPIYGETLKAYEYYVKGNGK